MNDKAVFTLYNGRYVLMHIHDNKAMHIYAYNDLSQGEIGKIINCRIEKSTGIDASFVRYSEKESGFINRNIKCETIIPLMYKKEPVGSKRACFTDKLSINGKYAVVFDDDVFVKCSAKIPEAQKEEFINAILPLARSLNIGIIIRTQAFIEDDGIAYAKEEIIKIHDLLKKIKEKSSHIPVYSVLYNPLPEFVKDIMYLCNIGIGEIVTDDETIAKALENTYEDISGPVNMTDRVRLRFYDDPLLPLCNLYGFNAKISETLSRKVYLKSGAYITIDKTEALTAVDVNSASIKPKGTGRDNFRKINIEAAAETVRQMVLRNLSGIIVIDFINMKSDNDYDELRSVLCSLIKTDRINCRFVDFTGTGLCELVRKRSGRCLSEIFCDNYHQEV